ncbi:ImmA/IrrE family metallo-endopeptidase [Rhizobium sp. PP-CC-3G-465]|uniref:ImmA/IrrE family metallo-endopeptidase n=1 Tax=Rhizobium sp. PP-CC-3G-465 TaxID=2135648 RepID=UPI00104B0E73|nr:uncharacterized protein DUF955 [Rhizobium sp. PP-CC-3G-465]
MALRHGFKSESNAWSRELRAELGLAPHEALCVRRLCEHLDITLLELSKVQADPGYLAYFLLGAGRRFFSAVTLEIFGIRWIVHNDAHDEGRQSSNIAHEIAHAVLHHAVPSLYAADGQRSHNKADEEEANWLGPALLISDEVSLFIASSGMSLAESASIYGCSKEVVQMRLNVCGARRRVA